MFRDGLKEMDTEFYAQERFLKQVLAMKDFEPEETNENTEALTQYYNEMDRFYTRGEEGKKRGTFLIEEWVKYRDEELMPSFNESQTLWIEENTGQDHVPYMEEFEKWEEEAFEQGFMHEYYEYIEWWEPKIKELKEFLELIPADRYLD